MNKRLFKILSVLLCLCVITAAMCSCSDGKNEKSNEPQKSQTKVQEDKAKESETQNAVSGEGDQPTKYGDAEVYQKDGKEYAKTDDGQEVELSGESFQELMDKYQKVQGTGSDEEKDILNKIQLILETSN